MKVSVCVVVFLGVAAADHDLHSRWRSFKAAHGKMYPAHVEPDHLQAFAENVRLIEEHNERYTRGDETYELGLNAHSDLSREQFRRANMGLVVNHAHRASANYTRHVPIPGTGYIDWRNQSKVSVPKVQRYCGSCYAFTAIGVLESQLMIAGEQESDLSEQDLIDCTYHKQTTENNDGCNGGDPLFTLQMIVEKGLANETEYPYVSGKTRNVTRCRGEEVDRRNFSYFDVVTVNRSEEMFAQSLSQGPLAITLDADEDRFHHYKGGIYNSYCCGNDMNHAVLLVGFGKDRSTEYWVIKNSWGPTWGEGGFMRLKKGINLCGIADLDAFYLRNRNASYLH